MIEFLKSSTQIQYRNYYGDMYFNPANHQLLRWYGKGYHFINDTMLLDMIHTQVQNKTLLSIKGFWWPK